MKTFLSITCCLSVCLLTGCVAAKVGPAYYISIFHHTDISGRALATNGTYFELNKAKGGTDGKELGVAAGEAGNRMGYGNPLNKK